MPEDDSEASGAEEGRLGDEDEEACAACDKARKSLRYVQKCRGFSQASGTVTREEFFGRFCEIAVAGPPRSEMPGVRGC